MTNRFISLSPSDGDAMRHVFRHGDSIFRGVPAERAELVRHLFNSGVIGELTAAGLMIPSTVAPEPLGGYPLAIEQSALTPPVAMTEIPPSLQRDSGVLLLRVCRILDRHDLALRDLGISSICIGADGKPWFHNLGAIVRKAERKFPYHEFHSHFLGPLRLISERSELAGMIHRLSVVTLDEDISIRWPFTRGLIRLIGRMGGLGRRIADIYTRFVVLSPFAGLLHCGRYASFVRELLRERRSRRVTGHGAKAEWTASILEDLERRLLALSFDRVTQRWTEYHGHLDLAAIARAGEGWQKYFEGPREAALRAVLAEVGGGTLLDVGANNGFFSMLGAYCGYATTAVDYDIGAIDRLYRFLCDVGSDLRIRPLIFDFVNLDRKNWPRFKSDVVFALGFVHHMRRGELLSWDVIVERLSGVTRKVLVTEFKPETAASHAKEELTSEIAVDYRLENLIAALEKKFASVKVIGDYSAVSFTTKRTMIVCRR